MNGIRKIHLCLRQPCEPLFSDKYLLWLAGTFALGGATVEAHTRPVAPGADELLLTNFPGRLDIPEGALLRVSSPTDRADRLLNRLGKLYGLTGMYRGESRRNSFLRAFLRLARSPFRAAASFGPGDVTEPAPDGASVPPPGRRVIFRVNVDWDSRGLKLLDRWCGRFGIRPTLAVAGTEIEGHVDRIREVTARHGIDIASHTWSHQVALPSVSRRRQREEIHRNKLYLEDIFDRSVEGFVAPYMRYDRRTFEHLAESGHRWFIRSWSVHPLPLAGFDLLDLGVNFYFIEGWGSMLLNRLTHSDLLFQLHLTDLPLLEAPLERALEALVFHKARFVDCGEYYAETKAGGRM